MGGKSLKGVDGWKGGSVVIYANIGDVASQYSMFVFVLKVVITMWL